MRALAILLGAAALAAAAPKEDPSARAADSLRRELSALESLRAEKLEELERREAARWESRYKSAARAKEADEGLRRLEEVFSRLAAESGRLEEEWMKARREADEAGQALEAAREMRAAFAAQVRRRVDEAAAAASADFPVGLEKRVQAYSQASQALAAKVPDLRGAMQDYFSANLGRLDLTLTRTLESRQALFENGQAAMAWRLRLGTMFLGELEKGGSGASQILLRTGNIQGRVFAFRQDLARDYNLRLREAVAAAAEGRERALLPFDVLQFKSTGSGFVRGEERTAWVRFREWFKAGGVTLYPLFAVGILALLMIAERLFFFARRATNPEAFMRRFWERASRGDWEGAAKLCAGSRSSLAAVLGAVSAHAGASRAAAEKAVREVLLKEIPGHEKRLSMLSALGTSAPLLGLLGTVAGLVTMFKVLNQLGSNDPKLLAGGIAEALVNTETGLAIAIPVLLVHGWLQERVDTLNAVLSAKSLEVMNRIWPEK